MMNCGGGDKKKESSKVTIQSHKTEKKAETKKAAIKASETIDLTNKGVGPVKSVEIPESIDESLAASGQEIFKNKCTACHRAGKKFIGPAPNGVLKRRAPEWVMNMILNPEVMIQKDPLAKKLLIEFNGSPMANQNLTQEEARAVLEYFRTLK